MIIPCDKIISAKMKEWKWLDWKIFHDVRYFMKHKADNDTILLTYIHAHEMHFDIPYRGKFECASALVDYVNNNWVYDKRDEGKIAKISRYNDSKAWYVRVKYCSQTTDLNREYLKQVVQLQKLMEEV